MENVVSVNYEATGKSTTTNSLGMREMQARVYAAASSRFLLVKAPPASGKSRALMFVALEKKKYANGRMMEEYIITFLTLNLEKILPAFIDTTIIAAEITVVLSVYWLLEMPNSSVTLMRNRPGQFITIQRYSDIIIKHENTTSQP